MLPNIKDYPEVDPDLPLMERIQTSMDLALSFWEANIQRVHDQEPAIIERVAQAVRILNQTQPHATWRLRPVGSEIVLHLLIDCEPATQRHQLKKGLEDLLKDLAIIVLIVPQASA